MTTTDTRHEPHGHCGVCHTGVHRYRGDEGLTPWQHTAGGGHTGPTHELDVRVDCCELHKQAEATERRKRQARAARAGEWAERRKVMGS